MSRSHSKIRHMQESNLVLEQRRLSQLSESMVSQSTISTAANMIEDCINEKNCPELLKLCKGSKKTAWGLILINAGIAGEFLSFGLSTIPSMVIGSAGAGITAGGLRDLYKTNYKKLSVELNRLAKCLSLPVCTSEEGCSM